jgi:RNA polymerase sigma-70 factor, ECF subfamily
MNISENSRSLDAPLAGIPTISANPADVSLLADAVLVSRTRAGDIEAFEQLVGRHERSLFRLAYRYVRDDQDAREILQDVFVTTWRKISGFEDRSQIGSWLYRVTVNASLMRLRARNRRPPEVDLGGNQNLLDAVPAQRAFHHSVRPRPDEQLESQELQRVIQRAINTLPPTLRSVFDLREAQGWSTEQTARMLGISAGAVKARFHRARRFLRAKIERYLVQ